MMSSKDHFLVHLAGAIASADWPDTTAAQQVIEEMKEVQPSRIYTDAKFQAAYAELDVLSRDLEAARVARAKRLKEREEARDRQRAQQQRRAVYQPRPERTTQPAHNEPEMEL